MKSTVITSELPMEEPHLLSVTMTGWERDALAALLDHVEPDTAEQSHVLRHLVDVLPTSDTLRRSDHGRRQ